MDDLPQGLNQTDEYGGILGPGLWRFVCASLTFPLNEHRFATDGIPVISGHEGLFMSLSVAPFLYVPCFLGEFKITTSHLCLGGTLVGLAMTRGMQLWTEVPSPHGDADRHVGTGSATKLLSVLQCS